MIILTDFENLALIGEGDPVGAIAGAIGGRDQRLRRDAHRRVRGPGADRGARSRPGPPRDIATAIRPITETLVAATPLIFVGLAVAISFRAGMFNIGGDGQLIIGALGRDD